MDRNQKRDFVGSFKKTLEAQELVVVTQASGLTVVESEALRSQMREAGAGFKIVKNTLARLSVEGTPFEPMKALLSGPTALAYSGCPVAAAKAAVAFANKNDKLRVVGGVLNGRLLGMQEVEQLASLPSLEELRAQLLGLFVMPATQLARITGEPASQLARVISAYAQKDA